MPYVRHFTVSVSLKNPRGLRFFWFVFSFRIFIYFFFDYSHRNANGKQWVIGKKQFNENPEEVNIFHKFIFAYYFFFFPGLSLACRE
jgi:hypothetical protein